MVAIETKYSDDTVFWDKTTNTSQDWQSMRQGLTDDMAEIAANVTGQTYDQHQPKR